MKIVLPGPGKALKKNQIALSVREGGYPKCFLKALLNEKTSENPHKSAVSVTVVL